MKVKKHFFGSGLDHHCQHQYTLDVRLLPVINWLFKGQNLNPQYFYYLSVPLIWDGVASLSAEAYDFAAQ